MSASAGTENVKETGEDVHASAEGCAVCYNNNIYLLQLGCHPVAVVILHVNKT